MSRAIVLLSGGLDSTTVLAHARQTGHAEILGLSFRYGQRHEEEIDAARNVAAFYDIQHHVLDISLPQGESVLMRHDSEMPHMTYEAIEQAQGVSPTYVPFRNGTFLSLASALAVAAQYDTIYAGVHAEDARGWAYPDCTPEFIGAMQNAIYVGTYHKVRLVAPLQYLMKARVVRLGLDLAAPYHLTLSCYEGTSPACGRCPTCVSRLEAFHVNDARDPIPYEFDRFREKGMSQAVYAASAELKRSLDAS